MGFLKSLLGLGVAAGTAFAAYKVTKRYQENKEIDMIVNDDMPVEKSTKEVVGDIARAATEVFFETKDKAVCAYNDVKDKIVKAKAEECECCDECCAECCEDDCECCEDEHDCCCDCCAEAAEESACEEAAAEAECCCCECEVAPADEKVEE